jgi:hypothetical protein
MKIIDVPQSGKLGIQVAMPGRYGQCRRAWVPPSNPQTPYQQNIRRTLATQAARWKSITEAQQNAWNAAAASHLTRARLGLNGAMTGLQLFVRLNSNLVQWGQPTVDTPSAVPSFPDLAPQNLVITNAAGVIALKLTCPTDPGADTCVLASAPVSNGTRRVPSTRVLGACPAPVAGASDITGLYTARFGVPEAGTRVFVKCFQMVDGWDSVPGVFTAVVPA